MTIYLDTSAAMKLVRPEQHSVALSEWLSSRSEISVLASVLIEVELVRATRRSAPDRLPEAMQVLAGIGIVSLSQAVVVRAAGYQAADLRSLDAIHVATAQHVAAASGSPLTALVVYDERLRAAARQLGLPVAAPGAVADT